MNKKNYAQELSPKPVYDCIIIGAGPGGLQAAIYLGRYNRQVLLIDRGGGRTGHAKRIENFLTQKAISGKELIEIGTEQALSFNARLEKGLVTTVLKREYFEVATRDKTYRSRYVIVAAGVMDIIPPIENVYTVFAKSYFTCIDCDGYKTRGKKLVVMGNGMEALRIAIASKQLYTSDVTLILSSYDPPPDYVEELREQGIGLHKADPVRVVAGEALEAVELNDGTRVRCEVIMADFGYTLNDSFLKDLGLKRARNGSFIVSARYESSLPGLYVIGPLNTGNDQAVIAAGQGAVAAIDINKRLFEF